MVKKFLLAHWKKLLCLVLILGVIFSLIHLCRDIKDRTFVIGDPESVIVISPDESQDVIVIGDPEKVNVKPNNKNKK